MIRGLSMVGSSFRGSASTNFAAAAAKGEAIPPGGLMSEGDALKMDVWEDLYLKGYLDMLAAPALRVGTARTARRMAVAVLGSCGGVGRDWGLKFTHDGRRLASQPEITPFLTSVHKAEAGAHSMHKREALTKAEEAEALAELAGDRLVVLLQEYGPLWQVRCLTVPSVLLLLLHDPLHTAIYSPEHVWCQFG